MEDRCDIAERGESLRVWFVEHNDGWTRAHEHPAKVEDAVDNEPDRTPPGTIWIRRTELRLEHGTALRMVKTWPRPVTDASPQQILRRAVRGVMRGRLDSYYRVTGTHSWVPDKERNSQRLPGNRRRPRSERAAIAEREQAALDQRRREELARLAEAFPDRGDSQ